MTYSQVVQGKQAIDRICGMSFPIRTAYQLFKMKKVIDSLFEFEVGQEKQAVEKYGGTIQKDGTIKFDHGENGLSFADEIDALLKTEVSEKVEPVVIDMKDIEDMSVSPAMIRQLEGFVTFR